MKHDASIIIKLSKPILYELMKNHVYKKKHRWNPTLEKYKANKSMRTHVMKEHNNHDTTNTLIKWKTVN
jgi:hypothetical protein